MYDFEDNVQSRIEFSKGAQIRKVLGGSFLIPHSCSSLPNLFVNLKDKHWCLLIVRSPRCNWSGLDPTIIISPTQPVAIGQPRQLQVSLKLTVCFAFSGFLRILIGILHQTNFYCLNLIFWILVMGCGNARFGQRGLKTTFTWTFGIKICRQGFRWAAPQASRAV